MTDEQSTLTSRAETTREFVGAMKRAAAEDSEREAEYARAAERRRGAMQSRSEAPRLEARQQTGRRSLTAGETEDEDAAELLLRRRASFPSEMRGKTVERDGKDFYVVEGTASLFGRSYEMWDEFGPYKEQVAPGAADATLASKPDVVFMVNHKDLAMARTGGPWNDDHATLELSADEIGLHDVAWLNPQRSDVKNLGFAIEDKIVTEQSFGFMIDEGRWNESFTEFSIVRFNIDRGDVSAVNYGANPYTSIAARQQEILTDLRMAGPAMLRAVVNTVRRIKCEDIDAEVDRIDAQLRAQGPEAPTGRSVLLIEALIAGE